MNAGKAANEEAAERWFALGVNARHEKAIARILRQKGFETFVPVSVHRHRYAKRTREFEIPLFPGYVFCRFDAAARLPVLTTPGVLQVVGAGRTPIPVEDEEMAAIRNAARAPARMSPCPFWRTGQKGRVTDGPLAGTEGIVMSIRQPVRLILSVSLLRRSVMVEVDAGSVVVA